MKLKYYLTKEDNLDYWTAYAVWVAFAFGLSFIAAVACSYNQHAKGSGIPELKSILAGVYIFKYLSFRTLIAKIIGLYGALSCGVSTGKEGPYVHIAACITNQLSKLRPFQDINTNNILKKQMLASSVAAGVTATFLAPIGGVLFSIEVTSTYYIVNNLWKAFF